MIYKFAYVPREDVRTVRFASLDEATSYAMDAMCHEIELTDGSLISPFVRLWIDITNKKQRYVVDVAIALVGQHIVKDQAF